MKKIFEGHYAYDISQEIEIWLKSKFGEEYKNIQIIVEVLEEEN